MDVSTKYVHPEITINFFILRTGTLNSMHTSIVYFNQCSIYMLDFPDHCYISSLRDHCISVSIYYFYLSSQIS